MTNLSSTFIENLKSSTNDLILIQKEIEAKIAANKLRGEEDLKDLKKSLDTVKSHLQESIKNHEKIDEKINDDSFLDNLIKSIDNIKPYFEEVLNKLKMYSHNLSSAIDMAALEIKLSYIYKVIFLREQKDKIVHKAEEAKDNVIKKIDDIKDKILS